jgi:hypothetical protein
VAADGVVIEGEGFQRVIIDNRICNEKGVFVISGNDVTVAA